MAPRTARAAWTVDEWLRIVLRRYVRVSGGRYRWQRAERLTVVVCGHPWHGGWNRIRF